MTDKLDDGGPAFPGAAPNAPQAYGATGGGGGFSYPNAVGMSLRDWFAGQALAGFAGTSDLRFPAEAVKTAYRIADAMLTARKQGEPR